MELSKIELKILLIGLQKHLNEIGEILLYTDYMPIKKDYLWELEQLEHKLIDMIYSINETKKAKKVKKALKS